MTEMKGSVHVCKIWIVFVFDVIMELALVQPTVKKNWQYNVLDQVNWFTRCFTLKETENNENS